MYVDTRYAAPKSRTFSFGAAFVVNGAILAGLIYSAPSFLQPPPTTTIEATNVPLPIAPPVEKPKQRVEAQQPTLPDPAPYVPKAEIETPTASTFTGSTTLLPDWVEPGPALGSGEGAAADPAPPAPPPLVNSMQDPRYLKDFQPAYPAAELRAERNGTVSVRVLIGIDGRVKDVRQLAATSPAFFEATRRQALAKWRFKPATRGGVPEESWKVMNVRFELENQ